MINKFSLLISLFLVWGIISAQEKTSLKVMTYNIWNGFEWGKDKDRKADYLHWMKAQKCHVIALQELCGYTPEKLKEDARKLGHDYSVLLKTSGYPVGLTSKYPIEIKERIMDGMGHGALHCVTKGIDFIVVHLHPGSIKRRREETKILLNKLVSVAKNNSNYLVLGDFNAHSPFDADKYDADGVLLNRYRERNKGKGLDGNIVNNYFDYSVISSFLSIQLEDVVQKHTDGILQRGSFPTRVFESEDEKLALKQAATYMERIDYILASPQLAPQCIKAQVCNGKENWFLSDHYPVIAEFMFDK